MFIKTAKINGETQMT